MPGTMVEAQVVRAVDGDTVRVMLGGEEESLRILSLDTEESYAGSHKPVTPWGKAAKAEAQRMFQEGDTVTLEFPGNEPFEVCWQKYRGNYGRLLVWVYLSDGTDFQEYMIRRGYSPYFVKYGYAEFPENHARYTRAERDAQAAHIGVWNQVEVNGSAMRNYAALGVWWHLRARIIDGYRLYKRANPEAPVYNTRLDYQRLYNLGEQQAEVSIFTELRNFKRVGGRHAVISIGSIQQPFQVFIPDMDDTPAQRVLHLLTTRYIPTGDDHPRRSYAYIKGPLQLYNDHPEMILTDYAQVTNWPIE